MKKALLCRYGKIFLIMFGIFFVTSSYQEVFAIREVVKTMESGENFSDTKEGSLEAIATTYLAKKRIIEGRPDGYFHGQDLVNRAEAAKMILIATGATISNSLDTSEFPDVDSAQWYGKYVFTAARLNIMNGYSNGLFEPAAVINTAEFLKIMSKAFGLEENLEHTYTDVANDSWYDSYAGLVVRYDLFPTRSTTILLPAQELTRKDVAIALYQYFNTYQEKSTEEAEVNNQDSEESDPSLAGGSNPATNSSSDVYNEKKIIELKKLGKHQRITKDSGGEFKAISFEFKSSQDTDLSSIQLQRVGKQGSPQDFEKVWASVNNTSTSGGFIDKQSTKVDTGTVVVPTDTIIKSGKSVFVDIYFEISAEAQSRNSSRWVLFYPEWINSKTSTQKTGFFPFGGNDIIIK